MATERVVSHYNRVKTEDRACLKQTTINNVLQISLNGKGTVLFDPREAVAEFLKRKSRRNSQPDTELFKDREYMRKFYRESMFVNYFCLVTLVESARVELEHFQHCISFTIISVFFVFLVRSIASVSAANSELGFVTHALNGMIPQYASTEVSGVPLCRNNKYVLNVTQ